MPFKSKAQERWMYANHPKMAEEWSSHTDQKSLPEHVKKRAKAKKKKGLGGSDPDAKG